jgi:hypothetical protein
MFVQLALAGVAVAASGPSPVFDVYGPDQTPYRQTETIKTCAATQCVLNYSVVAKGTRRVITHVSCHLQTSVSATVIPLAELSFDGGTKPESVLDFLPLESQGQFNNLNLYNINATSALTLGPGESPLMRFVPATSGKTGITSGGACTLLGYTATIQ